MIILIPVNAVAYIVLCYLPGLNNILHNMPLIRVLVCESQFYSDISGALIFFL